MRDESGVTVISNWERLRDISRHYAEGTKPPSTWNTQINVTAIDNTNAQKRVPDGLLWDDLRQDVHMLMITGLTYEEALKLLHGGDPIHHLLPGYMVQLMLAQMIDWGTLDLTPWSKYVPESN
ncbi:hypothetical protein PHMEG_00030831 [Phytophthora megakarya]|uniref:Uncharacterized protein n=1 Tax=Phytophthora megakarya TaxID=4795 RepID=A0A225UXZ7_9STRA|nr:hypothetical protein PHMEG_00030831 [Phytophthora megakarya]